MSGDFDIDGARKAGYSDSEIADFMGKSKNFDVGSARKSGYSDSDIIGHLSGTPDAQPGTARPRVVQAALEAPDPQRAPGPPQPRSWSDVPLEAIRHIPESAGNFVGSIANAFSHPVDTAKALGDVGAGVVSKMTVPFTDAALDIANIFHPEGVKEARAAIGAKRQEIEGGANAVGKFYADRYGTDEGRRNALATDPVGVAADAATLLTGGGGALARAPGVAGKVGEIVGTAGRAVDPATQAGNALKLAGKGADFAVSHTLGGTTGVGAPDIRTAARAGIEGNQVFKENMRGNAPLTDTVDMARDAVGKLRQERGTAYKSGMADVSKDKTVLDFQPIEDAVHDAAGVGSYKGVVVNRSAGETMDKIGSLVKEWKALDPAEYHTPEGLDALKRTVGDLRDSTEHGTPARVAADRVYNALKGEIAKQAPGYAQTMGAYADASDQLRDVTKTLSLGEKASNDTALGKLQSATRNNVQNRFGERAKLLDLLAEHEPDLPYALAGQNMNALAPRGLVAKLVGGGGGAAAVMSHPGMLAAAPLFSPRVVGESAYALGAAGRGVRAGANALKLTPDTIRALEQAGFQSGRVNVLAGGR